MRSALAAPGATRFSMRHGLRTRSDRRRSHSDWLLRGGCVGKAVVVPLFYPSHGPSIIPPVAVPSTVELLKMPYVLSQTGLLDAGQFIAQAKLRGVSLDPGELQL